MLGFIWQHKRKQQDLIHQIATPLTNVFLDLETLNTQVQEDQKIQLNLEETMTQMQTVITLLRRQARSVDDLHKQVFCPAQEIERIINNFHKPYRVKCQLFTDQKLSKVTIFGSREHFQQAIEHLLNNAAESYHIARTNREITIRLETDRQGLSIHVSDCGRGISKWKQPMIYWRTISFKKIKSGLGLFEATKIVQEEFGGELSIKSGQDRGTTASIFLPL